MIYNIGAVGGVFNSLIGRMVGYICAAICGRIFARDIDAVLTLVCLLIVGHRIEIQSGLFRCIMYYTVAAGFIFIYYVFWQSAAIFIEFIDELACSCRFNFAVLSLATIMTIIGFENICKDVLATPRAPTKSVATVTAGICFGYNEYGFESCNDTFFASNRDRSDIRDVLSLHAIRVDDKFFCRCI